VILKEIDQFAGVLDESRLNVVAPPRWVVAIEVPGQDKAKGSAIVWYDVLDRVVDCR
jgi:hypothetical protein